MLQQKVQSQEQKFIQMTETPVKKLVCTLAVPTIISMLITSIYNMADTFFVGKISTSATAAVGVSFSLMALIQALGFTIGMGSGNYIAKLLGAKEQELSERVASTGFFTVLLAGSLLAVIGIFFLDPFVHLLGATDTIAPYAKSYIRYILIGMPYMAASLSLNNIFRFQGSAFYGMLGIATGGILNILLDPIFIFVFDLGISGAAIATIISQFISFLILVSQCGKNGNIRIRLKSFTPRKDLYYKIITGGFPSFCRQGLASFAAIALNVSAGPYGDAAIAAMSIVSRVVQFAASIMIGFGQGFQPVCGFNYGARRFDRVLEAYSFCIKTSVVGLLLLAAGGLLFSPSIISMFRKEDLQVISIGADALRMQAITFPLLAWITMGNMLLQTVGKSKEASLLSAGRQGLFFLPVIFFAAKYFGLIGVQLSQPVADVLTFFLSIPLIHSELKEIHCLMVASS